MSRYNDRQNGNRGSSSARPVGVDRSSTDWLREVARQMKEANALKATELALAGLPEADRTDPAKVEAARLRIRGFSTRTSPADAKALLGKVMDEFDAVKRELSLAQRKHLLWLISPADTSADKDITVFYVTGKLSALEAKLDVNQLDQIYDWLMVVEPEGGDK